MKNGKNPTLRQKMVIKDAGFNPDNWLVCKSPTDELHLVHRFTSSTKIIHL
ncbi:DUF6906 family protein [Paenibacillus crassostreae]|uniref:DUF6906 family protein n=1 Tax=Paenibacillus crassostreae TaxID=1763538 RepID=UPI003AACC003